MTNFTSLRYKQGLVLILKLFSHHHLPSQQEGHHLSACVSLCLTLSVSCLSLFCLCVCVSLPFSISNSSLSISLSVSYSVSLSIFVSVSISPSDPAILLMGIYSKEVTAESERGICTPTFRTLVFTVAKGGSSPHVCGRMDNTTRGPST